MKRAGEHPARFCLREFELVAVVDARSSAYSATFSRTSARLMAFALAS